MQWLIIQWSTLLSLHVSPGWRPQSAMLLLLGNLTLLANGTEVVNEPRSPAYAWANAPLLAITVFINLWAAVVIRGKERNSLHAVIVCDCFINILIMASHVLAQSPWYKLGSAEACTGFVFYSLFFMTWNRLIPVGIAIFRYLMVCHAVRCHNFGGERRIWQVLNSFILGLCLTGGAVTTITRSSSFGYLRCIGREEAFQRPQLTDFYTPLQAGGIEFSGPLWTPIRLFYNTTLHVFAFLVPLLYGAVHTGEVAL